MNPQAGRDDGGATPRGIDVKPQIARPAEARDLRQGIDHAGRSGASRTDHHKWREPASTIFGYPPGEVIGIHLKILAGGYLAESAAPQARHVSNLFERMMSLLRQVNRW